MDRIDRQHLNARVRDAVIGRGPGDAAIGALEDAEIGGGGVERVGRGRVHHQRLWTCERQSVQGAQVSPLSELFQRGRAPGELCSGFTRGKSADDVLPAM